MKNLFLFSFLSFYVGLIAQPAETKKQMSLGVQDGYSLNLKTADAKLIQKTWKEYSKSFGKMNKNKKADEEFILGANIPGLTGANNPDVYTMVNDGNMLVFFDMKGGFLNAKQYPKEHRAAMDMLQEFCYEVERAVVKEELEKEENQLKKLNKELEKLKKDNASYHKDIEEAKEKIKKAEDNIVQNEKDQKSTEDNIVTQNSTVQKVTEKLQNIGKK